MGNRRVGNVSVGHVTLEADLRVTSGRRAECQKKKPSKKLKKPSVPVRLLRHKSAEYALRRSRSGRKPSARRASAVRGALRREGRAAASTSALSAQARSAARKRGAGSLKAAARKAVRTKGPAGRAAAARKAARTRARKK